MSASLKKGAHLFNFFVFCCFSSQNSSLLTGDWHVCACGGGFQLSTCPTQRPHPEEATPRGPHDQDPWLLQFHAGEIIELIHQSVTCRTGGHSLICTSKGWVDSTVASFRTPFSMGKFLPVAATPNWGCCSLDRRLLLLVTFPFVLFNPVLPSSSRFLSPFKTCRGFGPSSEICLC